MDGLRNWLRQLGQKILFGYRRFMDGRYGTDKLNMALLTASCVIVFINLFMRSAFFTVLLNLIAYALLFWAMFRMLSRNTYKRYSENRKYLMLLSRLKDREHRYYSCPKCRQPVRVPRGKGKIAITCPKCGEKFIRKT